MLVSGDYRLEKDLDYWVVIHPRRPSTLVYCFCLSSLWLGVLASGLVAMQLPKAMAFLGGLLACLQVLCCVAGVAVLVRGYLTKTLVFDGVQEKLLRGEALLSRFSDLESMELKPGKGILLRHRHGKTWWLQCRNRERELIQMCRALERVLALHFDDSKTFVASRSLVASRSVEQVF